MRNKLHEKVFTEYNAAVRCILFHSIFHIVLLKVTNRENKSISGSCLCGDVHYQFVGPPNFKWLRGESSLERFELAEAKHFATSFCKKCGSSLPWLTQSGKAVVIPAGTLDDDAGMKPMHNIYYADKASRYVDVCELAKYDELPIK